MSSKKRRNDIFLLAGIVLMAVVFAVVYFFTRKDGSYAVVLKNGNEIARYSLAEDITVPITDGDTVTNVLVIKDGKAFVSKAICPDQICVEHSAVSKAGQTIVCLPQELVIKIAASNNADSPDVVV